MTGTDAWCMSVVVVLTCEREPRRPLGWCGCRSSDASRRGPAPLTREVSVGHFVRLSRNTRRPDEPKMDGSGRETGPDSPT